MEIRKANYKDIDDILKLLIQVNMVHHNIRPDIFNGPTTKYNKEELKEIIDDNNKPIFVCCENDKVLGYSFTNLIIHNEPLFTNIKTLYIDDLCVDENVRGKNIGKSLYDYVINYAKSIGCYNVTLNVWVGNDSAMKFYEKIGMKPQKIGMEKIL